MATHRALYGENRVLKMLEAQKMYYDIMDQSKYHVVVKPIEDLTEVSDNFYTYDEMNEITGGYHSATSQRHVYFEKLMRTELEAWAAKLEASGKKSLVIDDHELVEALKMQQQPLSHYAGSKYTRRMDRIGYYRKRVKKRATMGDKRIMWDVLVSGWNAKYGAWLPHIPNWNRSHGLFKALQKATGYNTCRPFMPDDYQWCRHIWYNTEEYF